MIAHVLVVVFPVVSVLPRVLAADEPDAKPMVTMVRDGDRQLPAQVTFLRKSGSTTD